MEQLRYSRLERALPWIVAIASVLSAILLIVVDKPLVVVPVVVSGVGTAVFFYLTRVRQWQSGSSVNPSRFHRNALVTISAGAILVIIGVTAAALGVGQVSLALMIAGFSLVIGYGIALTIRRQQASSGNGGSKG